MSHKEECGGNDDEFCKGEKTPKDECCQGNEHKQDCCGGSKGKHGGS